MNKNANFSVSPCNMVYLEKTSVKTEHFRLFCILLFTLHILNEIMSVKLKLRFLWLKNILLSHFRANKQNNIKKMLKNIKIF